MTSSEICICILNPLIRIEQSDSGGVAINRDFLSLLHARAYRPDRKTAFFATPPLFKKSEPNLCSDSDLHMHNFSPTRQCAYAQYAYALFLKGEEGEVI